MTDRVQGVQEIQSLGGGGWQTYSAVARAVAAARRRGKKKAMNRMWAKGRGRVEAAFCSMKRWCGLPRIRYLGEEGARLQVYLSALAHNLKRMVKLTEAEGRV
ncbi:MAG: transposase [Acidobacteriota bacterium]|nr:MAG: transposase [Acidobacteriota bacterium]